jgi:hypothetical protein
MELNPDDYESVTCHSCGMAYWQDKKFSHQKLCSICYKKKNNRTLNQGDIQIMLWQRNSSSSKVTDDLRAQLIKTQHKAQSIRQKSIKDHNDTIKEIDALKVKLAKAERILGVERKRVVDLHTGNSSPVWGFFLHNKYLNLLIKMFHPDKAPPSEQSEEILTKLLEIKNNRNGEA